MNTQAESVRKACAAIGSQVALARDLGVQPPTVAQWALPNDAPKFRPLPIRFCRRVAELADCHVATLRPDDWHRIWPELIGTEGAPTVAAETGEAAHG